MVKYTPLPAVRMTGKDKCGWQKKLTYRIPGVKYAPDSGLVVFDLRKAYEIHEGRMKEPERRSGA